MEKTPLVSVVIPTYNHENYVKKALLSVIRQDYTNFEIIAIDDGSTDRTPDIAEEILCKNSTPYKLIKQKNQGAHIALNIGIGSADGEFISILNSDDFYCKSRLSIFVTAALESKSNFLFSKVRHIWKNGTTIMPFFPMVVSYRNSLEAKELFPTKNFELLRYNYAVTSGNFFFSRELYDKIGGFADYRLCHDWDFILKALIFEEPFFINEYLMSYRIHGKNAIIVDNMDSKLRESETESILLNYLKMAVNPQNKLSPCWKNWGRYWSYFANTYTEYAPYYEVLRPFLV